MNTETYDQYVDQRQQDELRQRYYENRLQMHPDCRDPGHPGFVICDEEPVEK